MAFQVVNGNNLRLKIGGAVITCESGFTFNRSAEEVEASSKDGDFVISGRKVSSISINALWDKDAAATNQFFSILNDLEAGTTVSWEWGGTVSGEKKLSGNGVFTDTSFDSQTGQAASWTATLSVSGAVTQTTIV